MTPAPGWEHDAEGVAEAALEAIAALCAQNGGKIHVKVPEAMIESHVNIGVEADEDGFIFTTWADQASVN